MTPQRVVRVVLGLCAALAAVLLSGCATTRLIDSEVRSFAAGAALPTPPAGASYRFERLPSQQTGSNDTGTQAILEAAAEQALAPKGMQRKDDANAQYSVQLQLQVTQYPYDPYGPRYGGPGLGFRGTWGFMHRSSVMTMEPTWYKINVDVLLREKASNQVVYETHATHDGPWADISNLLPAVVQAALRDYPLAPAGVRTVVVELPPKSP